MFVALAVCPIEADPATTWPPVGRALGAGCAPAWVTNTKAVAACSAVPRSKPERPYRTVPATNRAVQRRAISLSPRTAPPASAPHIRNFNTESEARNDPPIRRVGFQRRNGGARAAEPPCVAMYALDVELGVAGQVQP